MAPSIGTVRDRPQIRRSFAACSRRTVQSAQCGSIGLALVVDRVNATFDLAVIGTVVGAVSFDMEHRRLPTPSDHRNRWPGGRSGVALWCFISGHAEVTRPQIVPVTTVSQLLRNS